MELLYRKAELQNGGKMFEITINCQYKVSLFNICLILLRFCPRSFTTVAATDYSPRVVFAFPGLTGCSVLTVKQFTV